MIDQAIQRAQVYYFLAHAYVYPQENWLDDLPVLVEILQKLDVPVDPEMISSGASFNLEALQAQHREVFGLAGSVCYETEIGLPHEFRQSQELADIAGFYHAFGFQVGGSVHERPDYLASELEFMYLLALKEAWAEENALEEQVEICVDAQGKFLHDHLAHWIAPFCQSLEQSTSERLGPDGLLSPYVKLSCLAETFLTREAGRLGGMVFAPEASEFKPTPFNPDYTCAGCAVAELNP